MKWKLLPKGEHPFQRIDRHFQDLSKHRHNVVYDITRLRRVNGLGPDGIYLGIEEFEGYVVFYFDRAQTAVLDCPVNWKCNLRVR